MDEIYIECGECQFGCYTHEEMVKHIVDSHSGYSLPEAEEYASKWEEDAIEQEEAHNAWRAEEFRRTGHDPEDDSWDDPS